MINKQHVSVATPVGLAIFAMFFGAGNLIFPLFLGANAHGHLWLTVLGFMIAGVGVPMLGLFAVILYKGDYREFFSSLGRVPAHIVILLLVLMLGVVTANPRCSLITYQTLSPYLPHFQGDTIIFNLVFFTLVYIASVKRRRILDLIGYIFSPVKLGLLILLIVVACMSTQQPVTALQVSALSAWWHAMSMGYGTMDLLAAFFFCSLVYKHIAIKVRDHAALESGDAVKLTFYACTIGGVLLGIVYMGFIFAAHHYALSLQGLTADKLISAIAIAVFGKHAALFICLMVSFACFVTAVSLTAIATDYIQEQWLKTRANYSLVLFLVLLVVFAVSNVGFATIMSLSLPILQILYPALLIFTICRILNYIFKLRINAVPFYIMITYSIVFSAKAFLLH